MLTFNFKQIERLFPSFDNTTVLLWVWNADKIPPHIGVSVGKSYYSLTYKGVEELQTSSMIRKVKRLQIPILFIALEKEATAESVSAIFQQFDRAAPGGATCLSPVKSLFSTSDDIVQLAAFLSLMEQKELLKQVNGMFLKPEYSALPSYSWMDIVQRIEVLHAEK